MNQIATLNPSGTTLLQKVAEIMMTAISTEIIFIVEEAAEGGYSARAAGQAIFTEADTSTELHVQVGDAVGCHFEPEAAPKLIRPHFVRDEVIAA